jgi:hypothetical protein
MEKPLFKHFDCKACVYFGRYHDGTRWNDLYHCRETGCSSYLLARWGDDIADDYVAISEHSVAQMREEVRPTWPAILEAARRAIK